MERVVWIAEEEEYGDEDLTGDRWLLGTFDAHVDTGRRIAEKVEGLSAEEAIAWGRERAAVVCIRLGDGDTYYAAGEDEDPDLPRWPPSELPALVRRRPRGEEWKDRTPKDAPIEWRVEVQLWPERWPREGVEMDAVDHALRAPAEAAEVEPPAEPAPVAEGVHVYTEYRGIVLTVTASMREEAMRVAAAQTLTPPGWKAEATPYSVRPAGG